MSDIAIMTDSNSGLHPHEGKEYGISIIPMPIIIDGETYYEGVDISTDEFYKMLSDGALVTSSQPSPAAVMEMWDSLLKDHEEVVYIPMSSGLSHSYESASIFSEDYEGKVHVVDNHRISITLIQSVFDAVVLAGEGRSGKEIKEILETEALDASIYIAVDTLEYLKRGGRVTAAAAAVGSVLNIKPILTIQGDRLDAFAKTRGMKSAFRMMCRELKAEIQGRFKDLYESGELGLGIANTFMEPDEIGRWKQELQKEFPGMEFFHSPLTLSIGCHVGPGGLGVGVYRKHTI